MDTALVSQADARRVLAELNRRFGAKIAYENPDASQYSELVQRIIGDLFPEQRAFVLDPSKRLAALCTRRAGKTVALTARHAVRCLSRPRQFTVHVVQKMTSAAYKAIRRELLAFNEKWNIGGHWNYSESTFFWPNGSKTWVTSADTEDRVEGLRGEAYDEGALDESASFGEHFENMVKEALLPAIRGRGAPLVLAGTPGRVARGFFYDVTTNPDGWRLHQWSFQQNPFLHPSMKDIQAIIREDKFAGIHDPRFRREYMGEWVADDGMQVYQFLRGRNEYDISEGPEFDKYIEHLRQEGAIFLLGADLGVKDATALVACAYLPHDETFYVLQQFQRSYMSIEELGTLINAWHQRYRFTAKVCDSGALGLWIVRELNSRYLTGLLASEKREKASNIEVMNSDLLAGRVKIGRGTPLGKEWQDLLWEDKDKRKEDPRFNNHLSDACLYAWRRSRHYLATAKIIEPEQGSKEWFDNEARKAELRIALQGPGSSLPWWERKNPGYVV